MITRRESVLGGLLTIVWGLAPCACAAKAAPSRRSGGCLLDEAEGQALLAANNIDANSITGNERLIPRSGNRDLDYALAQTLSRLTDAFGVLPGFAFFDDSGSPNAYAMRLQRMSRTDGTVLFGLRKLAQSLAAPESPDAVVASVCAHEYGHILDFKLNLIAKLNAGQRTTKRSELHADFLAGYFAGVTKRQRPDYPAAVFATSRYAVGDTDFNSRTHHGTPDERAAATVRGFETAFREKRNLADAVQVGVNYVMTK